MKTYTIYWRSLFAIDIEAKDIKAAYKEYQKTIQDEDFIDREHWIEDETPFIELPLRKI